MDVWVEDFVDHSSLDVQCTECTNVKHHQSDEGDNFQILHLEPSFFSFWSRKAMYSNVAAKAKKQRVPTIAVTCKMVQKRSISS